MLKLSLLRRDSSVGRARYRGKLQRLLWTFYADSGILINKSDAAIAQLVERRHGKA